MTGFILLHGWGLGAQTWNAWVPALSNAPSVGPVLTLDAGYFGPERLATPAALAKADHWIGIGHSLGFAKLAALNIPWRGLVGLGAFLHFCPTQLAETGTPPSVLEAMSVRLDEAAADVLQRFAKRCGFKPGAGPRVPAATPTGDDLARLKRDLALLRELDAPAPNCPTLFIHARDDRIAPLALAEEAHAATRGSRLCVLETGGHALPETQTEAVLSLVQDFLHGLQ